MTLPTACHDRSRCSTGASWRHHQSRSGALMAPMTRLGDGRRRVGLGLILATSLGVLAWRARGWPGCCRRGNRRIARTGTPPHRHIELSVVQSAQPDHARRGHTADGDRCRHRLCDRPAGRAHATATAAPSPAPRGSRSRSAHPPVARAASSQPARPTPPSSAPTRRARVAAPTFTANDRPGQLHRHRQLAIRHLSRSH